MSCQGYRSIDATCSSISIWSIARNIRRRFSPSRDHYANVARQTPSVYDGYSIRADRIQYSSLVSTRRHRHSRMAGCCKRRASVKSLLHERKITRRRLIRNVLECPFWDRCQSGNHILIPPQHLPSHSCRQPASDFPADPH